MGGYGMLSHIGMSFQESAGTAYAANSVDYIPFITESITKEIERLSAEGMRGRMEEGDHYEGLNSAGGDIVMEAHPVLIGKFLKAWCNHASGTLVGSVWTHAIIPATSDVSALAAVPPVTLECHRDVGSSFQYYDLGLNTLSFEFANGALVKSTAGFVGGTFAWMAKTAPSFKAGSYYPWDVCSVAIAGAAVSNMSQVTITLNNALEAKHTLNGVKTPSRVKRSGFRTIEISGTMIFESDAEARTFMDQTMQTFAITVTGESLSTSQDNVLKIDLPRTVFTQMPINAGGPGLIEVGFSSVAKYDSGSGHIAKFTVINTQAAY